MDTQFAEDIAQNEQLFRKINRERKIEPDHFKGLVFEANGDYETADYILEAV